jgi:hypothetical protein
VFFIAPKGCHVKGHQGGQEPPHSFGKDLWSLWSGPVAMESYLILRYILARIRWCFRKFAIKKDNTVFPQSNLFWDAPFSWSYGGYWGILWLRCLINESAAVIGLIRVVNTAYSFCFVKRSYTLKFCYQFMSPWCHRFINVMHDITYQ